MLLQKVGRISQPSKHRLILGSYRYGIKEALALPSAAQENSSLEFSIPQRNKTDSSMVWDRQTP